MDRIVITDVQKTFQLKPGQSITVDGRLTDRVPVLAGVDLTIRKGEFITLVGPSGSGKSVLLDIVGGLTEASGGEAFIDATRVDQARPEDRLRLPAIRALSLAHGARERRICAGSARRRRRASAGARRATSSASSASAASRTAIPRSSRAACSSAWRSPARSRPIPRCC